MRLKDFIFVYLQHVLWLHGDGLAVLVRLWAFVLHPVHGALPSLLPQAGELQQYLPLPLGEPLWRAEGGVHEVVAAALTRSRGGNAGNALEVGTQGTGKGKDDI